MRDASPLRYPGGKWRVAPVFERLILLNQLERCDYFEPYAGGASLALSLLLKERVAAIHLNDLDPAIYAFWRSVLSNTEDLVALIRHTPVTTDEWDRQREIHRKGRAAGTLALGFATFFLNRSNHSGVLNGGMIGGKQQKGEWKVDARFNKPDLIRRIRRISAAKSRIHLTKLDAMAFLQDCRSVRHRLIYLDPPYYRPGRHLYMNTYEVSDHVAVRDRVVRSRGPWIVSYEDDPAVRSLYRGIRSRRLELMHTARTSKVGREVLFFAPQLRIPRIS